MMKAEKPPPRLPSPTIHLPRKGMNKGVALLLPLILGILDNKHYAYTHIPVNELAYPVRIIFS
jgi:hypothetical protein